MLATHSISKKISSNVFSLAKKAKLAKERGESIINGTLGVLFDENEDFLTFDVVSKELHSLSNPEIFPYSESIEGNTLFKKAVIKYLFNNSPVLNNLFYEVVASPGGSGALFNTFSNYLNFNETVLLPNYMWGSYKLMVKECFGEFQTYNLFDINGNFDIKNFRDLVLSYSKKQKNLIIILNNPCHNPTGYKLSLLEIEEIMSILKEACKFTNIILINDIAYIDFDLEKMPLDNFFKDLPENLLVVFAFSISKGLSSYGLRVGAQIAFSSSKKNIDDFYTASTFTCRSSWSNINNGGLKIFSNIVLNEEKYHILRSEQNKVANLLKERARVFLKEADEIGLRYLPYKSGFFITIPFEKKNSSDIEDFFIKNNIYFLVFENYIRVAICSIPTIKISGIAKKIQEAITL